MKTYWQNDDCTLYTGDAVKVLAKLPPNSVQMVMTSPPYWSLRDYSAEGQIGLEDTPEEHIDNLVEVFRGVRRVLREDGAIFLNYGDAYATSGSGSTTNNTKHNGGVYQNDNYKHAFRSSRYTSQPTSNTTGGDRKQGDLLGLPWQLALALREDGWWLRSAICWAKGLSFCDSYSGSVMPESVNGVRWERCKIQSGKQYEHNTKTWAVENGNNSGDKTSKKRNKLVPCPGCEKCEGGTGPDGYVLRRGSWRPTSAYEYVFLLAKNADYFCDAEAIREDGVYPAGTKAAKGSAERKAVEGCNARPAEYAEYTGTRNPRNVWAIAVSGTKLRHYAAFPEALVEPCIQAGTPKHACGVCGAPWAPVVESGTADMEYRRACGADAEGDYKGQGKGPPAIGQPPSEIKQNILRGMNKYKVNTYAPTCEHDDDTGRPLVLDPFSGTGTVGVVALKHNCRYIGIDISEDYNRMAKERLRETITSVPADRPDQTALFEKQQQLL